MDGVWEIELEMLRRIVALLYALAGLAEQAAGRSPVIRCLVLGLLRPAESVARKMVIRDSQRFGTSVPGLSVAGRIGDSAEDAARLARRFRELASALESLVALIFLVGAGAHGLHGWPVRLRAVRQTMRALRSLLDCPPERPGLEPQPDSS